MASDDLRREEPSDSFLVDENLTSVVQRARVKINARWPRIRRIPDGVIVRYA